MSATPEVQDAGDGLPAPVLRRGITESQWRTLFNLFPGARPDSALMVWDYCRSRQLDPMKKPCHIVPMRVKSGDQWTWRDVVMPGIYEYRITAQRTGLYLGHSEPEYGPETDYLGVKAPAWCSMVVKRWNEKAQREVLFPVKVWFAEVVATKEDRQTKQEVVNERWTKAPIQMLTKCTEAAALREAFPEELGGEPTAEEMAGQRSIEIEDEPRTVPSSPKAAQRKSEQQQNGGSAASAQSAVADVPESPKETPASTPAEPPAASVSGAQNVGTVAKVEDRGAAFLVALNTGFHCATTKKDLADGLRDYINTGVIVQIETRAPRDPRNVPVIVSVSEVLVVEVSQ